MGSNDHRIFQNTDEDELDESFSSETSSDFHSGKKNNSNEWISQRLKTLPVVPTGYGFDQKISAMFALELEEEIRRKTYSLYLRRDKIRLPGLITDLRDELL